MIDTEWYDHDHDCLLKIKNERLAPKEVRKTTLVKVCSNGVQWCKSNYHTIYIHFILIMVSAAPRG
jgi:predicted RNA-binding protein associated with RNAse of E/G family